MRLVRAVEPNLLRLFIPHLCHAACRIVVMAEDTKSLLGGGAAAGGGGVTVMTEGARLGY